MGTKKSAQVLIRCTWKLETPKPSTYCVWTLFSYRLITEEAALFLMSLLLTKQNLFKNQCCLGWSNMLDNMIKVISTD